jgi:hypothetical protein
VSIFRTPAALPNHLGRLESERKGGSLRVDAAPSKDQEILGWFFSQLCVGQRRSRVTPFIVTLFNMGPQSLVGLDATDRCVDEGFALN